MAGLGPHAGIVHFCALFCVIIAAVIVAASFYTVATIKDRGPRGATGAQGPRGAVGDVGPEGFPGPSGFEGSAGGQGPNGEPGGPGPAGPPGPAGAAGPPGVQGQQGVVGQEGPVGNGTTGLNCWDRTGSGLCEGANDINGDGICNWQDCQGYNGSTGPTGPTGFSGGAGGAGATGPAGARGYSSNTTTEAAAVSAVATTPTTTYTTISWHLFEVGQMIIVCNQGWAPVSNDTSTGEFYYLWPDNTQPLTSNPTLTTLGGGTYCRWSGSYDSVNGLYQTSDLCDVIDNGNVQGRIFRADGSGVTTSYPGGGGWSAGAYQLAPGCGIHAFPITLI